MERIKGKNIKEKEIKHKSKKKLKIFEIYTVLLILSILFMSVAYAEISNINFSITGEVSAEKPATIFISDVTKSSSSGVLADSIKYYNKTTLSSSVTLSTDTNSNIIYKITIYNNTSQKYYFKGIEYVPAAYDNANIEYVLDGITPYVTTLSSQGVKTFNLKFKYKDGTNVTTNQTLNSILNFAFSNEMIEFKVADIKYSAPSGATWEQFIDSEYNTYGLKIENDIVYTKGGKEVYLLEKAVKTTDVITANTTYNYKPEITLDKTTINLQIESGGTATTTLTATLKNVTGNLDWESSNTSVAEISGTGNTRTITSKAAGTSNITVSYGDVSATCSVTVSEIFVPQEITFTINGVQRKAVSGMKWGEWAGSIYDTTNEFSIGQQTFGSTVYCMECGQVLTVGGSPVLANDEIHNGSAYYIEHSESSWS